MGKGLAEAVIEIPGKYDDVYNSFYLDNGYYTPGYLSALAAYLNYKRTKEREFDCHPKVHGYLDTIGLYQILWDKDEPERVNEGKNYTPITQLCSAEATDDVTASINNCLRHFTGYASDNEPDGLTQLTFVVGELHDNVWSHGNSTGFSMAQKSAVPHTGRTDYYLEFAIVDKGIGFLEEIKRTGKADLNNIKSDSDAIQWCIQEGNSTKHADDKDEWAQQLPPEHVGDSPFGFGIGESYEVNHHQGLGLSHLVKLIEKYQGELCIVSGNAVFHINHMGFRSIDTIDTSWKGVAISCRFKLSLLCQQMESETNEALLTLMERLRG